MTIRHCSGLPEGDRGRLFPDWCIEPPDGARLESGLAHAYNLANGGQQSIFPPCFRPPKYPPKWGEWAEISVTLVY